VPILSLTDLAVRQLGPGIYFDTKTPAFGIRVGKNRKTWIVLKGENRSKVTIGHYPTLSLQDARKKAFITLASPYAPASPVSFADARDEFLAFQKARLRPYSHYQIDRNLKRHFRWKKPVDKVSHNDVADALGEIEAPSQRAHAQKDLTTFFNWCIPRHVKISPCLGLKKEPQPDRDRVLAIEELKKVWVRAKEIGYPYGIIVQLLILLGQRRSETAAIRRTWIKDKLLIIPPEVAKNGRETTVPLSPLALKIITTIPNTGDLLFPARGHTDKPFCGWGASKEELDKCGVVEFTHHDLRRTASSLWAQIGIPQHINDRLLNHVSGGKQSRVARIYNRYEYLEEKRDALERYERFLLPALEDL
jgi:integrase